MDTPETNHITAYSDAITNSTYTERDKDNLRWLIETATAKQWTLGDICIMATTHCSKSVLQKIIKGTYPSDTTRVLSCIDKFRKLSEDRDSGGDALEFIETSLARHIWSIADRVRSQHDMGILVGETQMGKTWAVERYAADNQANTIIVRCPVSASISRILCRLAKAMKLPSHGKPEEMISNILSALTPNHLIIVDEIQHVILSDAIGRKGLEQLRELRDLSGCGMILVASPVIHEARANPRWQALLAQCEQRGAVKQYPLPEHLAVEDVREVWTHYHLPEPSPELLKSLLTLAQESGWGRYTKRVRAGYMAANRHGVPYDWRYYLAAEKQLTELETGKITYRDMAHN